ncbi:Flavin-dependent oxidoreductase, luciferase family (includes alkanesulfonate monooxygenase SsuD and methylene tetrahydromethanopterin reductase) [Natronorubrum sediminis]|uniref:Flavin-dependent oxidoreductase, luciferase family (Includes alkanesulfonate monooxygenase SsuD and methylene tetrahydromethanopterin reductase) n=1 Tax=Natronorubrum sediminis TaxID=640943 RepID=A0A1H6G681_9EURY|nr:LLM class flavin-dependent oxidoreductase [Natronorubrum sediminis]SEH18072.1 Flavin-dependent oxidoreductase, luciferase family (includes alkanesulfonate monooxygenase SsuD and methylene tetrahydromethanopterin reductase) [Natronorubrum sediminis]
MTEFGFVLPDEFSHVPLDQTLEFARRADEAGLHSVWKQEASGTNGVATLAAISQCTSTVRIGTGVASVFSRSPSLLGMSAATLQGLSNGRALLGIGVSSPPLVERWHGCEFDHPLRRLRETIEIVRQVTAGGTVEYHGEVFDVGPYTMALETNEDVPVFNAAIGDANRALTGEFADGWLPAFLPRSTFSAFVDDVRESARTAGRDPDEITVAPWIPTAIDDDPDRAERRVRYLLAQEMAMGYNEQLDEHGFGDAPDRAHDLFRDGDREAAVAAISDQMVDELTVSGTESDVRDQFDRYAHGGADLIIAMPSMEASVPELETVVDVLGELSDST